MKIEVFDTLSGDNWRKPLTGDELRIGRGGTDDGDEPHVVLQSRLVSRLHAVLRITDGKWSIEHHGVNDTLINDRCIESSQPVPLVVSDRIRIGEFVLSLIDDDVAEDVKENDEFGTQDLIQLQGNIHSRLLELMELKVGDSAANLEAEIVRRQIADNLDALIDEAFQELDVRHLKVIARVAMYRDLTRAITAAGSTERQRQYIREDRSNPFAASYDNIVRMIQADLGLSLEPKAMETDCKKLDEGFQSSFERFSIEFTPGLYRYAGETLLRSDILNLIYGLGPLQDLADMESISEIMVINKDKIFVEKFGIVEDSRRSFFSDAMLMAVIERIVAPVGRRVDSSSPMVDAHLQDGSRVNVIIPPLAVRGPCLTIRKFSETPLMMEDLVGFGALTAKMSLFLQSAVKGHKNIVVSGGTGSGKTTLLNCLSGFIPRKERIITIEDTAELQLKQEHVVTLEARPANMEGKGAITMRDLVKNALRMRPDRVVVGECRGAETLDMLQAMNTGHDGSMTTAHANTPMDMMRRLETMVLFGTDMPVSAIREQIAAAVDLVVQLNRFPDGARRVTSIAEVTGIDEETGQLIVEDIYKYIELGDGKGRHVHTGFMPTFTRELMIKGVLELGAFFD